MSKPRIQMLQPRVKELPPRVQMVKRTSRTGRDADPRRTLKLNGAAWQRLRASVLAESPLCAHCLKRGVTTMATDVDHVSGDPSDNSRNALQPLCHSCHSVSLVSPQSARHENDP